MRASTVPPIAGTRSLYPLAEAHDSSRRRLPGRIGRIARRSGRDERRRREAASSDHSVASRILVVDDEASIRLICRINFLYAGFELLEAEDGESAIEIARRERPVLVLLDVMMPTLDGWQVARRLVADPETAQVPIAFLSARTDTEDRRRGYELGAVGYFTKPFDPSTLVAEIGALVARLERGDLDAVRREYRARFARAAEE